MSGRIVELERGAGAGKCDGQVESFPGPGLRNLGKKLRISFHRNFSLPAFCRPALDSAQQRCAAWSMRSVSIIGEASTSDRCPPPRPKLFRTAVLVPDLWTRFETRSRRAPAHEPCFLS